MIAHDVLHVFCDAEGAHGNALGVVRDGAALPASGDRQAIAAELGFSETVFVDDAERGAIDIYTPSTRLPFAGHPCVGAAWLLGVDGLVTRAGPVAVRRADGLTWIEGRAAWAPGRTLHQYGSAAEVEALPVPPPGAWVYAWAWQDEAIGRVRARGFPGRGDGIDEDEATGAAALVLTDRLGRALEIVQGRGSRIHTRPKGGEVIEIGGRVRRG
ncbi:PhzF family phenazine biosynthesis protein [Streptomyces albus subsp. chlorinus]|uniref:PhzF family phenazine biosynthesis protein n=1 Tax=Streptomyces albus TaxID=1888 RepID=UPI00156F9B30|nr:PhzF family phenazine biosynthesis protein [Streptomyces albus]NSC22656.1 PhzF family phenazine biosynthesis protein [Streptomyces albus subsp. chlorinus]